MALLEYDSQQHMQDQDQMTNRVLNRNSLEFFKQADKALMLERIALGKIRLKMFLFNTCMILLLLLVAIFNFKKFDWIENETIAENIDNNLLTTILLLNALILAYSVIKIRRMIKRLHNAFPNECFIAVHVINSFIYAVLYLILGIMLIIQNDKLEEISEYEQPPPELSLQLLKIFFYYELVYMMTLVFQIYMDGFLLYLILRFTNTNARGIE